MMLNDLMATSHANQIRDKLYREFKKKENVKFHNVAGEVLAVNSMGPNGESNTLGIICNKKEKKSKKRPPTQKKPNQPSIIYSDEPLEDPKSNSTGSDGSVQGFDRTFNLGPCFDTTTIYTN